MAKSKKNLIITYLKRHRKPISIYRLSKEVGATYPTTYKWVQILHLQGLIEVREIGGVKLVNWRRK